MNLTWWSICVLISDHLFDSLCYFVIRKKHHSSDLNSAATSVSQRQMLITISKVAKAITDPRGLPSTVFAKLKNSRAFFQRSLCLSATTARLIWFFTL